MTETIIKPKMNEFDIETVYGEKFNVTIIPNSIMANEAIRDKYIKVATELKTKRINDELDDMLVETIKALGLTKKQLIEEILIGTDADFAEEAETIVDKDRKNRKQLIEEKIEKAKKKEKESLSKEAIDELRKRVANMRLSINENLETMAKVWDTVLVHCVRLSEDRRKKIFESEEDVRESLDSDTKDNLVREHIRINDNRGESEAKN